MTYHEAPPVSRATYRELVRGIEQQMFFLGGDVMSSAGNLLVRAGFEKFRPPGQRGSSRYRCVLADGAVLELHGFFASLEVPGEAGFLYLRSRHQAYVHFGAKPDATGRVAGLFTRASGPGRSHFYAVSARFLGWIEAYETWLEREFGPTYRERSYAAYPHRWKAPQAAREWFSRYLHCPTSP